MESSLHSSSGTGPTQVPVAKPLVAPVSTTLSAVLQNVDEVASRPTSQQAKADQVYQSRLAQSRLGFASSLYVALRARHSATAAHSLRVAIGCSAWSQQLQLSDEQRDEIEIAALLHDIGKIGVPDNVLLKPSRLDGEEVLAMERAHGFSREIISSFCSTPGVLDNIHYTPAWFDGRKHGYDRQGDQLPLGARIIGIVDAFDSMTTDHVYRRAFSRERAVGELFTFAGTQFDPCLVHDFCGLLEKDQMKLNLEVARRWLQELNPDGVNGRWSLGKSEGSRHELSGEAMFHFKLLDSMHDGVVFVDPSMAIRRWNRAAERLTGIAGDSVLGQHWLPSLVELRDENTRRIADEDCPVAFVIGRGVQTLRRLTIRSRNGEPLAVDVHMLPVVGRDGVSHGAAVMLRDATRQVNLEERVQSLHEIATRDALTQVANRAEFDRVHTALVDSHLQSGQPCSLIICDIDHFKKVNDNFGHQAGDAALIAFANILRSICRSGDLVARYGGEEFGMLCADCDNATAAARAEEIRRTLAETPQPALGGKCLTASFGVTEVQGGDTPETMLRRADRALYQAKDGGRNMVVQLGSGIVPVDEKKKGGGWFSWLTSSETAEQVLERDLVTPVPLKVAAEKLRGFVADQHAEIESIEQNHIVLKLDGQNVPLIRRRNDRPVPFFIELNLEERQGEIESRSKGPSLRTVIHVTIRPKRVRDRRRDDVNERAKHLLVSLKSYLMAHEIAEGRTQQQKQEAPVLNTLRQALGPLLGK